MENEGRGDQMRKGEGRKGKGQIAGQFREWSERKKFYDSHLLHTWANKSNRILHTFYYCNYDI